MKFINLLSTILLSISLKVVQGADELNFEPSLILEDILTRELAQSRGQHSALESSSAGPNLKVEKAIYDQFPVSVAVSSKGRKFVSYPHWEQNKGRSLVEIKGGKEYYYPNASMNNVKYSHAFNSIHAIYIDALDRLWVLDTGKVGNGIRPVSSHIFYVFDLKYDYLLASYTFPKNVEYPTSQLQDIRFDANLKYGFITDATVPGIAVLNLETGESFRRLDNHISTAGLDDFALTIEGKIVKPGGKPAKISSNGIEISKDKKTLYYTPLSSRTLYSVPVEALINRKLSEDDLGKLVKVEILDKGSASAGLISDKDGNIYITNIEQNSITKFNPNTKELSLVVRHPNLLWPDTLSVYNNTLFITANQMNRRPAFNNGVEGRKAPYFLFSIPI
ncbi:MRJP-domain-containing protein [Neoconidiobolus thromboides FSU 785]|nr:MRJP-domain-containing protein [Neoconidiobolus thromboides FSU 785]